jgi:transposase, IS30 family
MSSPLTLDERYLIHAGLLAKLPIAKIAQHLGRDRSTINDECHRGKSAAGVYCPHRAQRHRNAASARSAANAKSKSAEDWQAIKQQLKDGWSPEQISGRRALLREQPPISFQAIYLATKRYGWTKWLHTAQIRQHLQRPARRPFDGSAASIHERPQEVMTRIKLGDWEADTAVGKKTDKQRVLVMVERQSLYMELGLIRQVKATRVARMMKRRLDQSGIAFDSVTTDRGTEFRATGDVMPGKAFVCDPYAPNQRATNENQIGLMLRRDLPKGKTMDKLTPARLKRLQDKYNNRPRKSLGNYTPNEIAFNRLPRVGTRT